MNRLRSHLRRIDGRGYKAYKELQGSYDFGLFRLDIDHVQGDPFAAPSRLSILVPTDVARLPGDLWQSETRRIALEDFLGRAVQSAIGKVVKGRRGIGKSGQIAIADYRQQILRRNAVLITGKGVEARLTAGLPAAGRTILAREAEAMLLDEIPQLMECALLFANLDAEAMRRHVESVEDQAFLRAWLQQERLVAFVADGSVLPRASGIDDRPMVEGALPTIAPDSLARIADLPNAGHVRGLAIPQGVTLIVGGGFHGKSTLLHALERGVYDHLPGDGRQQVATEPTAVKIRAEDGRTVRRVNISPFIDNLPFGRDTSAFTTENASGSTSQAANIMEALETGTKTLLIDEDTSATNFMIRDARMQQLVHDEQEPITPLLHRVRELHRQHGVSTVIVMGGCGDYLQVADTVIMLDAYRLRDVTAEAQTIAGDSPQTSPKALPPLDAFCPRLPDASLLDPSRGRREVKIDARGTTSIAYGEKEIDLSRVEQLVDAGQTRAIGLLLRRYRDQWLPGSASFADGLRQALQEAQDEGLDILPPWKEGELALPRLYELAAAANRLRDKHRS